MLNFKPSFMKIKLIFFLLIISLELFGQYPVGQRSVSFNDPARSNRTVAAEVYYPAVSAGTNTALANGEFPVLAFGHGFVMAVGAYDLLWESIVPEGYIMILPTTEGSLSPSHSNFGQDLAFVIKKLKEEGNIVSSPFYAKVGTTSAVMGHSMGGGASFLAAEFDTTITAIATLAPAVTNPSSALAAKNVNIPALVFAGINDCVTPPSQHQIPMYDSLASDCKTYIGITGASHCQFANSNFFCSTGEATCSPSATINRTQQLNTVYSYLLPWLAYQLKGDIAEGNNFQDLLSIGTGISYQQNCSLTTISALEENESSDFVLIQQQVNNIISVKFPELLNDVSFQLYDLSGKIVYSVENHSGTDFNLDLSNYPTGFYILKVVQQNKPLAIFKLYQ